MTGFTGLPGSAGPWHGGAGTQRAFCVLAPNPGPMTLDGTNTWIIGEPDSGSVIVIDPGPDDLAHWAAVQSEVANRDATIGLVLLTHGHLDHSAGARMFAANANCNVLALDPTHTLGSEGLVDGDVIDAAGAELRVIGTPGHSSDSLTFLLPADGALLTGDTVLGRGTTVVAHPDGVLADYLASLQRLREFAYEADLQMILPGHGPTLDSPEVVLDAYLDHRERRLDQIRAALAFLADEELSADALAQRVVEVVYADVPPSVWPAALLSVRAQLEHLLH